MADSGSIADSGSGDAGCTTALGTTPVAGAGIAEDKIVAASPFLAQFTGRNASVSGGTIAIGGQGTGIAAGQVNVYVWDTCNEKWTKQGDTLVGSDTMAGDYFGGTVDLSPSSDQLLVGAAQKSTGGAFYVFKRSNGAWTQSQRIFAPNAGFRFGYALAQESNTIAIGGPLGKDQTSVVTYSGLVYVYTRPMANGNYSLATQLVPAELASNDLYGASVAMSGGTVVAGAPGRNLGATGEWNLGSTPGKAWVFTGSGATWTQKAYLTPSDGANRDGFGAGVALSGNTIVIGAPYHDPTAIADAGAAYVFTYANGVWTEQAKLVASDAAADAWFGYTVAAVSESRVVIGAPGAKKLYTFTRSGNTWTEDTGMHTACSSGAIGYSLSASGNVAVSAKAGTWVFDLLDPDKACVGP